MHLKYTFIIPFINIEGVNYVSPNKSVFGDLATFIKLRVSARNNYTRLRRILVRLQGTSAGAYRDMCWWM